MLPPYLQIYTSCMYATSSPNTRLFHSSCYYEEISRVIAHNAKRKKERQKTKREKTESAIIYYYSIYCNK